MDSPQANPEKETKQSTPPQLWGRECNLFPVPAWRHREPMPQTFPDAHALLPELSQTKGSQNGLRADATEGEAANFFKTATLLPPNLSKLCNGAEVCSIGESHNTLSSKEYFAGQIADLAKAGYTRIGFEMIKADDSQVLKDYIDGKVSADQLIKRSRFGGFDYDTAAPEYYVKILDAAKAYNQSPDRVGPPIEPFGMDTRGDDIGMRNQRWAQVIDGVRTAYPKEKVATYSGLGHLGYPADPSCSTLAGELRRLGHKSTSISLDAADKTLSSHDPKDPTYFMRPEDVAGSEAVNASVAPAAYAIKPGATGDQRADLGVALPWIDLPHPPPGTEVVKGDGRDVPRVGAIDVPLENGKHGQLLITTNSKGETIGARYKEDGDPPEVEAPGAPSPSGRFWSDISELSHRTHPAMLWTKDEKPILMTSLTPDGKLAEVRLQLGGDQGKLLYPPLP